MSGRPGPSRRLVASLVSMALGAALAVSVATVTAPPAAAVPAGFQDQVVWTGLTLPTEIAFAPDGKVFVAEKAGQVWRYDSLTSTNRTLVADLRTVVHNWGDRGLLGLAVDPRFGPDRPYLYVQYTYDHILGSPADAPRWGSPGATYDSCPSPPGGESDGCVVSGRLSKLVLSAPGGAVSSEQVLIEDWCQQFPSHSIGTIAFGADGYLYAGGGDGASYNVVDYGQYGGSAGSPTPVNPCGDGVAAGTRPTAAAGVGGALRSQAFRTDAREAVTGDISLSGSVVRVDPDTGAGVPGNPWFAKPGATTNEKRVIAYGFRNPFRFSFRGGSNEMWLGDVGWTATEEINLVPDAASMTQPLNYGWPCYEGTSRQSGYDGTNIDACETLYTAGSAAIRQPFFSYSHGGRPSATDSCPTGASSITGVAYYNRPSGPGARPYPDKYSNALFFTDYNRRCIWSMLPGSDGRPDPTRVEFFHAAPGGVVDLVVGPSGDIFYPNIDQGEIHRIAYVAANTPPVASFTATPASGPSPLAVTFDASGSTDADGDALTYSWDLDGDGTYGDATGRSVTRTYTDVTVTVGLLVTDARGATATATRTVSAGNTPPVPTITSPTATTPWSVGDSLPFAGSANDAEDGSVPSSRLQWLVSLLTCDDAGANCVTRRSDPYTGASGTALAPDWSGEGNTLLEFRLTATDSGGRSATTAVRLVPRKVALTDTTVPSGLSLTVGSAAAVTPFTRTVIVGSQNSLSAPSPQTLGQSDYTFQSWSDGGAATHTVNAPASATTYTATYTGPPVAPAGLVAEYGFDETSGTAVTDGSGRGNAGTTTDVTRVAGGRYGGALSFNGTSSRVVVPDADALDLSTGMTLEAWVNPATSSGWRTAVLKENPAQRDLVYSLYAAEPGAGPSGYVRVGSQSTAATRQAGLPTGAWSHVATTYDGSAVRLYVDGALVATTPRTGSMTNSTGPLTIGGNAIWGEWFSGLLDEVRVYNRALTTAEITADRSRPVTPTGPDTSAPAVALTAPAPGASVSGTVTVSADATDDRGVTSVEFRAGATVIGTATTSPYSVTWNSTGVANGPLTLTATARDAAGNQASTTRSVTVANTAPDTTPPTVSLTAPAAGTVSGTVTIAATASDDVGVAAVEFRVGGSVIGTDAVAPYTLTWDSRTVPNGPVTVTATARDAAGNTAASSVAVTVSNTAPPAPAGLVAAYGFDEGAGTTVTDASGRGNTGTAANTTRVPGRFGGGLSFNGSSSVVTVPSSPSVSPTAAVTVTAWVNPTAAVGWRTVVLKENPGRADLVYGLYGATPTDGAGGWVVSGSGNATRSAQSTSRLTTGRWTHVAMTYDGANVRHYQDGVLVATTAASGAMAAATGPLRIGGNGIWGEYFAGVIDEVRVYDRALTSAEVAQVKDLPVS